MKIRVGDHVVILSGKDKGKQGKVMRLVPSQSRVVIEDVNMRTKHIKKTHQSAGQKLTYEAPIHVSNVAIVDPKSKKPTRIGFKIDEKTGKKVRIARSSGEVLVRAVTKVDKEAAKAAKVAKEAAPGWKETSKSTAATKGAKRRDAGATSFTTAHRSQGG